MHLKVFLNKALQFLVIFGEYFQARIIVKPSNYLHLHFQDYPFLRKSRPYLQ